MTAGDVTSIVSIVLAVVAIVLSVIFFRMSSELSETTKSAAERIGASVDRLEKLFDRLYSDTFALMKDTYQDMRKHAWPEGLRAGDEVIAEAERKTDEKLNMLRQNLGNQLDRVMGMQMRTEGEFAKMKENVRELVSRAIAESRKVEEEAREETVREHIVEHLRLGMEVTGYSRAEGIVDELGKKFDGSKVVDELRKMREDGVISYQDELGPKTKIRLV